jgi:uncharacterized protein (TIGR02996 family)
VTQTDERMGLLAGVLAEQSHRSRGVTCPRCEGDGWYDREPGDGEMSCLDCHGTGKVLPKPPDDTPRLVYADWLEENGEPERAEFIRVQVELSFVETAVQANVMPTRLPGEAWNSWEGRHQAAVARRVDCRNALRRRERELWATHSRRWFVDESIGLSAALDDFKGPAGFPLGIVRRGFVCSVTLTAEDWLKHADALSWRPGQPCRECSGRGIKWESDSHGYTEYAITCPACRGTGHRPMPLSAQPIEQVTLTTRIDWYAAGGERLILHDGSGHDHGQPPAYECRMARYGCWWDEPKMTPAGERRTVAHYVLAAEWPQVKFYLPGDKT